jgi:hypothetical protein
MKIPIRCRTNLYDALLLPLVIILFISVSFLPSLNQPAFAAEGTLTFDPSPDSRVVGYKLYFGPSPSFGEVIDLEDETSCVVSDLQEGATYYFAVKAYDSYGNHSEYSEVLAVKVSSDSSDDGSGGDIDTEPPAQLIIDNGQPGTTAVGTWSPSGAPNYYGSQSLYNKTAGATYSFEAVYSGTTEIALWWTEYSSRCDNVKVLIYDGDILLDDTIRVNQQVDGGQWNTVGTYTFIDSARVVIVSSGTCSTCADAVRFLSVDAPDLESLQIEGPAIVNEGEEAQFTATAYYSDGSSRSVQTEADWETDCPTFSEISSQGLLTANEVDSDQTCIVTAEYTENGILRSNDIDITIRDDDQPIQVIIDNGQTGTTAVGSWYLSGGLNYYGTKSLYSKTAGATYSFETNYSGAAEVALWWTVYTSRCDSVKVRIYDGSTLLSDTIRVNQKVNGGRWNPVGTYRFNNKPRIVIVSSGTCTTCADAVRITSTTSAK